MAGRRCPGQRCPVILVHGERRCPVHEAEYETKRGTTTARGYGSGHVQLRARWQRRIDDGEDVRCADGCGIRIIGTAWQLGHDHVNGGYLGPQTIRCNARDGGRRGRAAQT